MLESNDPGGGAFALFLRPHPREFRQLMCPHPGEFAQFLKKNANARGLARGWALLELTDSKILNSFVFLQCQRSSNKLAMKSI